MVLRKKTVDIFLKSLLDSKGNAMLKKFFLPMLVIATTLQLSCSNIFKAAATKTSDEAILEDAIKALDALDYTTSITNFNALSANFKAKPAVIEQWAGAYAGKCGLDFVTYFTNLGSASLTGSTLFRYFMNAFKQVSIDPNSCRLAELKMNEISTDPTVRTASQNLFMMILGMVKIGTYLRYEGDRDSTGSLGDGTMDATFNACTVSATDLPGNPPTVGQFSDADIKQIVTGLGQLLLNFAAVGSSFLGSGASSSLSTLTTACALLTPNPCNVTDTNNVTAGMVTQMRQLIHTAPTNPFLALGIGTCTALDVTTCCPL